jgi:hypothetical protein
MHGVYPSLTRPTHDYPEWFILTYITVGIGLVALIYLSPAVAKKIRLPFSAMCIKEYKAFFIIAVLHWPGLWLWDYIVSKKK